MNSYTLLEQDLEMTLGFKNSFMKERKKKAISNKICQLGHKLFHFQAKLRGFCGRNKTVKFRAPAFTRENAVLAGVGAEPLQGRHHVLPRPRWVAPARQLFGVVSPASQLCLP